MIFGKSFSINYLIVLIELIFFKTKNKSGLKIKNTQKKAHRHDLNDKHILRSQLAN